ncbi:energy transducer TonB [Sphingomonas desiccabilis]|uniref:Protein TonB n=1 Tax=Sphingomonas desiccabilis TaxID=429134 RepID=A0A4Q2IP96_9SPHN|nr:energy transducer TonB [Sphingomonas desiccabilis]MBB3911794.1 protein TonB [Sphingomonas desiccabilis]RXZ31486.1 energy transducer TonB [Sphingomonas desiccabilis]
MRQGYHQERRHRIASAVAVLLLHAGLGIALVTALGFTPVATPEDSLRTFDLPAPAPPSPPPLRPAPRPERKSGAAAPPNRHARPVELVAPPVPAPLPPLLAAAPIAGPGADAAAGAAPLPGPGTGAGGVGQGTGSGASGSGTGSGGGSPARLLRGAIRDSDYPRAARRGRVEGSVTVRFTVDPAGRATGCAVTRSSGSAELDATTCRLIEARYRYAPARDAAGRPVVELRGWRQDWWLEPRR